MKAIINILLLASLLMVAFSAHSQIQNGQWQYKTTGSYTNYGGNYISYNAACQGLLTTLNSSATFQFTSSNQNQPSIVVVNCYSTYSNSNSSYYVRFIAASGSLPNSTCSDGYCTCNEGYIEQANACVEGDPEPEPEDCNENAKRLTVTCAGEGNCIESSVCNASCKYAIDPDNIDTRCYTEPNGSNPNQVYCTNNYIGVAESCSMPDHPASTPDKPTELDCASVGMVNNATNTGCLSPESPACPENYIDPLDGSGCQPMSCPLCTFWSEVGGDNGGGGCIKNLACEDPILDNDNDGIPNKDDPDIDGDGVPNANDPDVDGDGIPNSRDNDIDGDGVPNGSDNDMDGDGQANSVDSDMDGDGVPNEEDEQEGADEDCASGDCGFDGEDLDGQLDDIKEQYAQQIEDIQNDFATIFTPLVNQSADLPIYSTSVQVGSRTIEAEMDTSSGDLAFDRIGVFLLMIAGIASVIIVLSGLRGS